MSFSKAVDLLQLARLATGHVGITLEEIEREFGCVRRTAQRMTEALCRVFPDTEDYMDGDGRKRWRIRDHRKAAEFVTPSAEEIAALELAANRMETEGLNQESAHLRSLRSTLKILTPGTARRRLETDEEALLEAMGYAARPGPRPEIDEEVDRIISEALKGPFRIRIAYKSRSDKEARWRLIEPLGLLLGARRYLVAFDVERADGQLRHYRVEDISAAEMTPDWFELPTDFNLDQHARRAFGTYQNDFEYGPVTWKFSPEAASHARNFRFHPDQTVETLEDGSLIVRFTACGHLEMCWHLYAWGDQVEVIEPPELARLVGGFQRSDFPGLP